MSCHAVEHDPAWLCLDVATYQTMSNAAAGGRLFGQACADGGDEADPAREQLATGVGFLLVGAGAYFIFKGPFE